MPIDTRFPSWMLPKDSPMDSLLKGVAAGSQIADSIYRQKALYAHAQQFQQQQDLRERELTAENESRTLANEVRRTQLDDDTLDYNEARAFYPKLATVPALEAGKMERPVFRNVARQADVERAIAAKTAQGILTMQTEGRSRLLSLASEYPDNTDPEYVAKATKIFGQYNLPPGDWNMFQNHQEHAQRISIAKQEADRRTKALQQATGMLDQLDADGNVIAKQFVDENTGEPIRGWHAVPKKGGGWERMKTPDAIEPKDLTPAQNISRLNTLARIEQSNLKALDGLTGKEAKAQAVSIRKRLDAVTEELNAIGARPAQLNTPVARDTGVQYGPPNPGVRVRNKATGKTGWWRGGSPDPDEYELIQ